MTTADVDQSWQVWLGAGTLALAIHALALAVMPGRGPGGGGQGAPTGQGVLVLKGVALPSVELRAAPAATQAALATVAAAAPVAASVPVVAAAPAMAPTGTAAAPAAVAAATPTAAVPSTPAAPLAATVPSAAAVPIPSSLVAATDAPPPGAVPSAAPVGGVAAPVPAVTATVEEPASPVRVAGPAPPVAAAPVAATAAPVRIAPSGSAAAAVVPARPAASAAVTTLRPATVIAAAAPGVARPVAGAPGCGLAGVAAETFCSLVAGVPVGAEGRTELGLRPADGVFFADDYLVVTVRLPVALGAGHLYVSYLDHTGDVVHLRPNALSPETEVPAGARLRLGADADERAEGVRDWRFDPPFGQGLIIAWLTRRPLALFPRPEVEPAAPFLAEVKEALTAAELVWAAHRPLESRPRS